MQVVILAAGQGTRMLPITKTIPKEMLPVGSKPVIHHIVEGLSKSGIRDMMIVSSPSKQVLDDYFRPNEVLEEMLRSKWKSDALRALQEIESLGQFSFAKQYEQKWTGHAILQAKDWITDDFFMVIYADEIHHPRIYQEMLALHQQTGKGVIMGKEVSPDDVSKYGILEITDGLITDIIEKPAKEDAPSRYALFTPLILPRSIFALIEQTAPDAKSGEIYPRDAAKQIMQTTGIVPYISSHPMRDASGNVQSWLETNIAFAENPRILE